MLRGKDYVEMYIAGIVIALLIILGGAFMALGHWFIGMIFLILSAGIAGYEFFKIREIENDM